MRSWPRHRCFRFPSSERRADTNTAAASGRLVGTKSLSNFDATIAEGATPFSTQSTRAPTCRAASRTARTRRIARTSSGPGPRSSGSSREPCTEAHEPVDVSLAHRADDAPEVVHGILRRDRRIAPAMEHDEPTPVLENAFRFGSVALRIFASFASASFTSRSTFRLLCSRSDPRRRC